jgi:lipopolysaccharide transport system permease protein
VNPHKHQPTSLGACFRSFWLNRQLIWLMTQREVASRYQNSLIGIAWSFLNPIFMLTVYTFVFSVAFSVRWAGVEEHGFGYFSVLLFAGLIVHGVFAECINGAPGLIAAHANFVKKVVFPLEVLPWISVGSALFHACMSVVILLAALFLTTHQFHWTAIFFPLVLAPLVLATLGLVWFLSALGVYVRDISQLTGLFSAAMLFLSPVFYPASSIPAKYQIFLKLNPLAFIIESSRDVLLFGRVPDFVRLAITLAFGLAIAQFGFWWFQRSRKGFADVL